MSFLVAHLYCDISLYILWCMDGKEAGASMDKVFLGFMWSFSKIEFSSKEEDL